jgi:hypothetical protein
MTDRLEATIAALEAFEPTDDDAANVHRLNEIFEGFRSLHNREKAIPAMFSLLERFPRAELGNPGPLVHALETIVGYQSFLQESLAKQPVDLTVWMVNRILNATSDRSARGRWLEALRRVLRHPGATESARQSARDFIEHQEKREPGMTRDELERVWATPGNWSLVYRCAEDPRVIVPRRRRWMGWTINFAHPLAWPVLFLSVLIAVGPGLLLLFLRLATPPLILAAVAASIAVLVALSHWEASRSRE